MKTFINILKWIVGLLFIFSGLVKANDPLGLSYKMLEFFEAWGWHFMDNYTLYAAVAMNVCEVMAGVALLISWQIKFVNWFLLALISFFTYLTAYVLFSGKIKECGCFGDCIPLSGTNTFLKDLILLIMILILLFNSKYIKRVLILNLSIIIILVSIIFTIGLQIYVLRHLPLVDCLPYKKGNNIKEQMKIPAGAVPDSFTIVFQYRKNEEMIEFDKNHFPNNFDSTYIFQNRIDKLVRKGNAEPAILDFSLHTLNGRDTTDFILNQKCVLLLLKDLDTPIRLWQDDVYRIDFLCHEKKIPFYIVTAMPDQVIPIFNSAHFTILRADATVLKTAARVQPTYMLLDKGTIKAKYSFADIVKFENESGLLP